VRPGVAPRAGEGRLVTRGGRLPDPGLGALCGRCEEPREAHGGEKHYGACPDQAGLYARRFSIAAEDRPEPIEVRVMTTVMPISAEVLADALPPWDVMMRQMEENARAFAALPIEEQERITAEKKAAYEVERCEACSCHPDEHGP
jgi:hypothetical protein